MVLPHLQQHIADNVDSVSTYMLLYHEVTVTNLIEVRGRSRYRTRRGRGEE